LQQILYWTNRQIIHRKIEREHIKIINNPYIKSNFAQQILSTGHIQTNLKVLHKTHEGPKLNIQNNSNHKIHKNAILNDQITYNDYILYDIIILIEPPHHKLHTHPPTAFQALNTTNQHSVLELAEDT
jgi:hypothetical protein